MSSGSEYLGRGGVESVDLRPLADLGDAGTVNSALAPLFVSAREQVLSAGRKGLPPSDASILLVNYLEGVLRINERFGGSGVLGYLSGLADSVVAHEADLLARQALLLGLTSSRLIGLGKS